MRVRVDSTLFPINFLPATGTELTTGVDISSTAEPQMTNNIIIKYLYYLHLRNWSLTRVSRDIEVFMSSTLNVSRPRSVLLTDDEPEPDIDLPESGGVSIKREPFLVDVVLVVPTLEDEAETPEG